MEPGTEDLVRVGAILLTLALLAAVVVVLRMVKARHEIGDGFFNEPRPVQPTQPDPEEVKASELPAPQSGFSLEGPLSAASEPLATLIAARARPDPQPPSEDPNVCVACGQHDDPKIVELEDWQQVGEWFGRMRAKRGKRNPIEPGRKLYADRYLCRSCAQIASHLNEAFVRELELERQRATVAFDARARKWEREGLLDAVKRAIALEDERYLEHKAALEREDTKRKAAKIL